MIPRLAELLERTALKSAMARRLAWWSASCSASALCASRRASIDVTPDTVTSIADYAFRWSTLDSIRLSDNVKTIGPR